MKFALGIEYDGSQFYGWQRQSHAVSVQQTLEKVLSNIADESVQVNCAGRTDTGVHATGQVVDFSISNERPLKAWTMGANTQLPDSVAVRWRSRCQTTFMRVLVRLHAVTVILLLILTLGLRLCTKD